MSENNDYQEKVKLAAESVKNFLMVLDVEFLTQDLEDLKIMVKNMEDSASKMSCLPFPETISKSSKMYARVRTFKKIVELVECRKEQFRLEREEDEELQKYDSFFKKAGLF